MVESDFHSTPKAVARGLERAAKLDELIQSVAGSVKNTLVLFTADHSFDFHVAGGSKRGASFSPTKQNL